MILYNERKRGADYDISGVSGSYKWGGPVIGKLKITYDSGSFVVMKRESFWKVLIGRFQYDIEDSIHNDRYVEIFGDYKN